MRLLAVIPARGGSKGVPRKNLRPLAGLPLIAHSIEAARECVSLTRLIVSTDDEEIAGVAREHGAHVPWLRPAELASDTASGWSVVRHALEACEEEEGERYDGVVLLQPTSPLRRSLHVQQAIDVWRMTAAPSVVSVCENEHPAAWLVAIGAEGRVQPWGEGGDFVAGRQQQSRAYRLNGAIYAYGRELVLEGDSGIVADTRACVMPQWASIDIDSELDFVIAEAVHRQRHLFEEE